MGKTARRTSDPRRLTAPGHYLRYRVFSDQPLEGQSFFSYADLAVAGLILLACVAVSVFLWFRPPAINYHSSVQILPKTAPFVPLQANELPTFNSDSFEEVEDGDPEFFEDKAADSSEKTSAEDPAAATLKDSAE
jgi:hypothetical protein